MTKILVRRAGKADAPAIVEHNCAMAWETERKALDANVLSRGVAAVFDDPGKGFYLVAETEGAVAGQLMITTEWSDWRDGWFWWIQSVYVRPESRRQGVFRALFDEAQRLANQSPQVIGIRLYVERDNEVAQQTYRNLDMVNAGYFVFEARR